jgi:hypothetical protein
MQSSVTGTFLSKCYPESENEPPAKPPSDPGVVDRSDQFGPLSSAVK